MDHDVPYKECVVVIYKDENIGQYPDISHFLGVDTDTGGVSLFLPPYRRYIPNILDIYRYFLIPDK